MKTTQRSLSYVDRDNCISVTDQVHEYIDEDMSDEDFRALIKDMRSRRNCVSLDGRDAG